jgi:signal transduction histidine kinase
VPELPGHLGFASIRERAESVGGRVEIESAPGEGTTVRAWIPRL